MRAHRSIASLLLPVAVLGSRLAMADGLETPPAARPPQPVLASPAGNWAPKEVAPLPPLPEPASGNGAIGGPEDPAYPKPLGLAGALTLHDLEQIALESNPTLVQTRMAVQAAQGRYVQAGLCPNPEMVYIADEIGNDGTEGLQGMGVGQEIVTGGKLRLGRAVAGHEVQQARHGLDAQRWRVLNDVRAGYYEVLLAQRMIELNQELVRIGQEGVDLTAKALEQGEVSLADVLQARIEADTAGLGLVEAQNRHRAAWQRLAAVLGSPETEPQPLAGRLDEDLPDFTWDDTLRDLLARSPELAQARAGVERARCELALQYAERKPNFAVGAAAKYDTGSYYTVADLEMVVPLPLFNRNQGNIMEAQAGLIAAQREVRRVELELQARLAEAFEQYANGREHVQAYTGNILPDARQSLDLVGTGYREGEFGYLTLLTAQRTFFDVNLSYLNSLSQLWAQTVELEGLLLRGGLEAAE
jgi:cobalt-zinc-cadmium efflux system outer membrane protein